MYRKHFCAAVAIGLACSAGASWTWPESEDIVIPANTQVSVTDSDVPILQAAKTLTLGASSYVYFDNATVPLTLSAAVTGPKNSRLWPRTTSYVVLTGNNANFLGDVFVRGSSTLVVSNRYGLGCAESTGLNSERPVTFGGDALTNDAPVRTCGALDTTSGHFVQNGAFTQWSSVPVFADATFNSTYSVPYGSPAFKSDTTDRELVFNGKFLAVGGFSFADSSVNGTVRFNAADNEWTSLRVSCANRIRIICGAENALPTNSYLTIRYRATRDIESSIDLGGYDQSIKYIAPDYKFDTVSEVYEIKSDAPATLTLTQPTTDSYYSALKFTGQAALHYAGQGTLQIYNALSTSTGPLTVSSGTVEFGVYKSGWVGGGWSGNEINITGGRLVTSSPRGILNPNAVVTVSGDGVFEIAGGITNLVKKLVTPSGTFETGGEYSVADLKLLGVTGVEGEGNIIIGGIIYVDPVHGSDLNYGHRPNEPLKTLKEAMATVHLENMIVHLAEGTYSEETMQGTYDSSTMNFRAVVPDSVKVYGAGADKTFIKGNKDSTNPIQCVMLGKNSEIHGVTLCESYGTTLIAPYKPSAKASGYIVDCVISNNYAKEGAAGRNGNYLRCLIADNSSYSNCDGIYGAETVANCVFWKNNNYNDLCEAAAVVNCTFISKSNAKNRWPLFRGSGSTVVYNCVIDATYGTKLTYYNCLFPDKSESDAKESTSTYTDCIYAKDVDTQVDAAFRPVKGHHPGIDRGKYLAECRSIVESAFGAGAAEKDFALGQRVYSGAIDIGAGEYDMRPEFTEALSKRYVVVSVTNATENVTRPEERKVLLSAGESISFTLQCRAWIQTAIINFEVAGEGSVKVYANDTCIGTYTAGAQVLRYKPTSSNEVVKFVSEGEATAVLSPVDRLSGLTIILK